MIDENQVPKVLASSELSRLAAAVSGVGDSVGAAVDAAYAAWSGLPQSFDVEGANGAWQMLDQPRVDGSAFRDALQSAADALNAGVERFAANEQTRADFLTAVEDLNSRLSRAKSIVDIAMDEWTGHRPTLPAEAVPEDDPVYGALRLARRDLNDVYAEVGTMRDQLATFRTTILADEQHVATALALVAGGDIVRGDHGVMVTTSHAWDVNGGAPFGDRRTLTQFLDDAMRRDVVDQVLDLAAMDEETARRWIEANPGFVNSIVTLPPEQGAWIWDYLSERSGGTLSRWGDGEVVYAPTGPLGALMAAAPWVIGNLNGAPAEIRDAANRAYLVELERNGFSPDEVKAVRASLDTGKVEEDGPPIVLLGLFPDGSKLRAAIAVGDVERADTVLTMTHGINNDTSDAETWTEIATHTYLDARDELARRGMPEEEAGTTVATIAYLGWESGGKRTVWSRTNAWAGAERLTPFVEGIRYRNPNATVDGWFHSYGTTMGGHAQATTPGLYDSVTFFGSAGIDATTADALSGQVASGNLRVSVTFADGDDTAVLGRRLWSKHPISPEHEDGIAGAHVFSSEAQEVNFGPGIGGESAGEGLEKELVRDGRTVSGHGVSTSDGTGYLDKNSTSYLIALRALVGE